MIRLLNTDCLWGMESIPDNSVDLCLTDPPYGTTQCKWDAVIPFDEMWRHLNRIVKPNGAILLFGAEPFSSSLRCSNIKNFKYDWVWDKVKGTGYLNAKRQPMRNHEIISVFYRKQCAYYPQKTKGHTRKTSSVKSRNACITRRLDKHGSDYLYGSESTAPDYNSTERYPRSIQVFSTDTQKSSLHPTQKPVALLS